MSTVIQDYKRAISSGGYLHPETRKNMADTRPLIAPELPPSDAIDGSGEARYQSNVGTVPKRREIGPKIFLAISLLLFIGALWLAYQANPGTALQEIWTPTTEIQRSLTLEPAVEPWLETQNAAIEQIRAWERVFNRVITEYFALTPEERSRTTLCISTGADNPCTEVLPPLNSRN